MVRRRIEATKAGMIVVILKIPLELVEFEFYFGTCTQDIPSNPMSLLIRKEDNAHDDDIHALMKLSNDTFVSGSKDNSLKLWNFISEEKKEVEAFPDRYKRYTKWITALGTCGDTWASASRDGKLNLWSSDAVPEHLGFADLAKSNVSTTISKSRNRNRINCIHFMDSNLICAGMPGQAAFLSVDTLQPSFQTLHQNDWLYCVRQLPAKSDMYALVIGSSIELHGFDFEKVEFSRQHLLWREKVSKARSTTQRAHISDIEFLGDSLIGASCFDSKIRVFDVNGEKTIQSFHHQGRVWSIKKTDPNEQVFASSADDGTFKIWDLRESSDQPKLTSPQHEGRVSQLLINDAYTTLVSSSCPDVLKDDGVTASLRFWDLRQIHHSLDTVVNKENASAKAVPQKMSYADALSLEHSLHVKAKLN
jgi:WD40 repeat protein